MRNPLYKRLLLLVIVIAPIFWLVFTKDGQRRSDAVLLWLLGKDELRINPKALSPALTRNALKKLYADIHWRCQPRRSAFGDSLCAAPIGLYNDIPANYATLFFRGDRLAAVKITYLAHYHEQILKQLHRQLGPPQSDETVYRWPSGGGLVIAKRQLNDGDEPALLWIPAMLPETENPARRP